MFAITERLLLRPAWPEDVLRLEHALGRTSGAAAMSPLALFSTRAAPLRPSFLICLRSSGEPVGMIGLHGSVPELSCWIVPDHRRRGIATEAARALLALGKGSLRLDRIIAREPCGDAAASRFRAMIGFDGETSVAPLPDAVRPDRPRRAWTPALAA